jgi:hypothetical protein
MARDKQSTKRRKGARDGPAKHFLFHVEVNISRAKRLSGGMLMNYHTLCTETLAWILGGRSSNRQQWAKWQSSMPEKLTTAPYCHLASLYYAVAEARRSVVVVTARLTILYMEYTNTESEGGNKASE